MSSMLRRTAEDHARATRNNTGLRKKPAWQAGFLSQSLSLFNYKSYPQPFLLALISFHFSRPLKV
ncbi:hypothetical protein TCA2_1586 [Paenibacillus sp. TCA20]|nr:hypothetical protein TCA2_1586 [Paenibacillus sp. TCA20]